MNGRTMTPEEMRMLMRQRMGNAGGNGSPTGGLGEPVTAQLFREIQRATPGRPQIVADSEVIDAGQEGEVVLKISTAAPMFVEFIVCVIDHTPMFSLATCPLDLRSWSLQREDNQTEIQVLSGGPVDVMAVFSIDGVMRAQYLAKADIIHQGSEMKFQFVNRDLGANHTVDIAAHGFLVSKAEMKRFYSQEG